MKFERGQLVATKTSALGRDLSQAQRGIVAHTRETYRGTPVIDVYWFNNGCTMAYLPKALIHINPQEAQSEV